MQPAFRGRWGAPALTAFTLTMTTPLEAAAQTNQELLRAMRSMEQRILQLEHKVRTQDELIETLRNTEDTEGAARAAGSASGDPASPATVQPASASPATVQPASASPATVQPASASPATVQAASAWPATVQPASAPWSPSQPIPLLSGSRGYLNLSLVGIVDAGWSTRRDPTRIQLGDHDPIRRGFSLPSEELVLEGAVDPYFRAAASIVFHLDEHNQTEVELEELFLVTTSLPWNLQLKAGQFLAEFGRVNQQHPHAWDFVDVPLIAGRVLGPEGLRNPGARLSYLLPTPFYAELALAVHNSEGGKAYSFRNEEALFGRDADVGDPHSAGDLLYVPRLASSFEVGDEHTVLAGVSGAFGPNASGHDTDTQIYGFDLYWKWKPVSHDGGFPFLAWQTEAMVRRYEAGQVVDLGLPRQTLEDYGVYSQIVYGPARRWVTALRGEWVDGDHGASPSDESTARRVRISPNLTFHPTEFSKVRLQYNYDHSAALESDHSLWLQTEFLLGAHAAHRF